MSHQRKQSEARDVAGRAAVVLFGIAFGGRALLGLMWVDPVASDRVMFGALLAAFGALCIASDWTSRLRAPVGAAVLVGGAAVLGSAAFLRW